MAYEIDKYKSKLKDDNSVKNNYIENTMYYNIFILIYKRIKIIRESLNQIFSTNSLFENNINYQKKYLIKFTSILKIFHNFLTDNNLQILYDISNVFFLKINSFICKTFKILHSEDVMKKIGNIFEEDPKIVENFFTTFFFLSSHLLINKDKDSNEYYYQISQNRKGFYFESFKVNFEKYFGYPQFKAMIEFLDILKKQFRQLCDDKDALKLEEVNDNSIELDKRESCSICLEYLDDTKDVHINPCNHLIHKKCLQDMLSKMRKNLCPLCKRVIQGIKEDPSFKVEASNYAPRSLFSLDEPIFSQNNNLFLFGSQNDDARRNENEQRNRINLFSGNLFSVHDNNNNNGGGLFGNRNNNSIFNNNFRGNLFGTSLFG